MIDASHSHDSGKHITVRVLRQAVPDGPSYWERFRIPHEPEMNVISVLQRIAAHPKTADGRNVAPVSWDCNCLEEVCGACTMIINGRVRQACSAIVDRLLEDQPEEIELRPATKFPVVRDLVVDRSRLFRALTRVKAWVETDGYYDVGRGPTVTQAEQERAYPLSECMSCGCCLDACPQYVKIDVAPEKGESAADHEMRENAEFDRGFIGAHAISQAMLFNQHPTGKNLASDRLDALTGPGGIQVCGNAQNCVAVCPKSIPLTTSIARAGRAVTLPSIKKWFDR